MTRDFFSLRPSLLRYTPTTAAATFQIKNYQCSFSFSLSLSFSACDGDGGGEMERRERFFTQAPFQTAPPAALRPPPMRTGGGGEGGGGGSPREIRHRTDGNSRNASLSSAASLPPSVRAVGMQVGHRSWITTGGRGKWRRRRTAATAIKRSFPARGGCCSADDCLPRQSGRREEKKGDLLSGKNASSCG